MHENLWLMQGKELDGEAEGILGMKQAWPSTIRTVKGDHKRCEETYFSAFPVRLCPSCPCSRCPIGLLTTYSPQCKAQEGTICTVLCAVYSHVN